MLDTLFLIAAEGEGTVKFSEVFLYSAVLGGVVLAFQLLMMLLGLGEDGTDLGGDGIDLGGADGADLSGGFDAEVELGEVDHSQPTLSEAVDADIGHQHSPWFYELISIRTLSAAATFFGLAGKTSLDMGLNDTQSMAIAVFAGFVAMYTVYWLFKQVYKLETSGNENVRNAIGKHGRVNVAIPGNKGGAGKVQFKMQQRLVEYQAVTEEEEKLPTGENVVVVGIVNSDTVRVSRIEEKASV